MTVQEKNRSEILWLIAAVGLVVGGIVTVAGLALFDQNGPVPLIAGLIILAFGGGSLFTYLNRPGR